MLAPQFPIGFRGTNGRSLTQAKTYVKHQSEDQWKSSDRGLLDLPNGMICSITTSTSSRITRNPEKYSEVPRHNEHLDRAQHDYMQLATPVATP
jgi:hypothetical protein